MSNSTRQSRAGKPGELVRRQTLAATLIALVAQQSPVVMAQTAVYRIDPAKSTVTIHVGKAGAFSFMAGHVHEVGGPIQTGSVDVDLDMPSRSRVRLSIASS